MKNTYLHHHVIPALSRNPVVALKGILLFDMTLSGLGIE